MADQLLTTLMVILGIVIVWTILKMILKITSKIFTCGIGAIALSGALYFVLNYINVF